MLHEARDDLFECALSVAETEAVLRRDGVELPVGELRNLLQLIARRGEPREEIARNGALGRVAFAARMRGGRPIAGGEKGRDPRVVLGGVCASALAWSCCARSLIELCSGAQWRAWATSACLAGDARPPWQLSESASNACRQFVEQK